DSSAVQYKIDIQDNVLPTPHKLPTMTLTKDNGDIAADGTFAKDVDVSSLDDGTIRMFITAYDQYGNFNSLPVQKVATKASGLALLFGSSVFKQVNSDTPTFADVLARSPHAVQKLSQLAIEFSNPITLTRHDSGTLNNPPGGGTDVLGHDVPAAKPYFVEVLPNGSDGNTLQATGSINPND